MLMRGQVPTERNDRLIYDVGMHRGEDTEYYLKKGFFVIGFEADPHLADYCRTRFPREIEEQRLVIVEGAIVDPALLSPSQRTTAFFRNLQNSVWGTLYSDWAERNAILGTNSEVIHVNVVNFGECLKRYGIPYYIKVDIEGADTACLKALEGFQARPAFVSIESEKVVFRKLREELNLLERLGYTEFAAVQQGNVDSQQAPSPSREGVYAPHSFQFGSSGLFGRELPAAWKSKVQITRTYRKIFLSYRMVGDSSFLKRFRGGKKLIDWLAKRLRRPIPGWYDTHAKHASVSF